MGAKIGEKWQRIQYMPCTPIGKDGKRITASKEHIDLSRKAGTMGMVLLKNEASVLPFKKGDKIAMFGKGIADYVKGGGGSGDTTVEYVRTILEGMRIKEAEGKISLFEETADFYEKSVAWQYESGKIPGRTIEPKLDEDLVKRARDYTDTALIVICRFSGEDYDREGKPFDGDFYLSHEEQDMVDMVLAAFEKVVVVLNTGGMMDTSWFAFSDKVKSALLAWQAGMEGGLATADILVGDELPSGHLADTFAIDFDAYPSSYNYDESDDYVEYTEDIYVGYRYFETIPGAKEKVVYPFGFGLTYTDFELTNVSGSESGGRITITATVKNIGKSAGQQVVQVYANEPQGLLYKAEKSLCGFQKTKLLKSGECETVTISIDPYSFASYDDKGWVKKNSYVLEKGEYKFLVGFNVRDTVDSGYVYSLSENVILKELSAKCVPNMLHKRMRSDGTFEILGTDDNFVQPKYEPEKLPIEGIPPMECKWRFPDTIWEPRKLPAFIDVYEGKMSLEEFMELLTDEQKISLLGGQPNRGVAATWGFGNMPLYGIPNVMTADGPAGLRVLPECGVNTTAFPCASLLACTWDPDIMQKVGKAAALEVYENGIGVWLSPAINIHRTPRCGRNFEYMSEDPFLTGKMAASLIRGVQGEGIAVSLKHFACNNKEKNRKDSDSRLSERALREIYLKGFEICVKEADPFTIMSSYNLVNGIRASMNKDLLTGILRDEWNFDGVVTTDWNNHCEQWPEINAGNDVKMGIGMPEETLEALNDGRLDREALDSSVERLLKLILKIR